METILCKGDYFLFCSVFIEKNNQISFFLKPKPVQTDQFQFGSVILEQNSAQTNLAWFSGLTWFFPV
jgi:hypothetical protein